MEHVVVELLNQFERGTISRRQLVQSLTVGLAAAYAGTAALAAERSPLTATSVNHISYGVADYGRTRDFYSSLLGMKVSCDNGKQCNLAFGDTVLIARHSRQPGAKPYIDHMAYTIEHWDKQQVEEVLRGRGLDPKLDQESFLVRDPDGYQIQICSKDLMSTC